VAARSKLKLVPFVNVTCARSQKVPWRGGEGQCGAPRTATLGASVDVNQSRLIVADST
jgi:hypothetical protein